MTNDSIQEALLRIDEVSRTKKALLDLSTLRITELPQELFLLDHINELILIAVPMTHLSSDINKLQNLKKLHLSYSSIKCVPKEIGELRLLETLSLESTNIRSLPDEIGMLSNLKSLSLENTFISNLPRTLANLSKLKLLNLSRSNLGVLPAEIGCLTELRSLDISYTDVKNIPAEIRNLQKLLYLDISGGSISGGFSINREPNMNVDKKTTVILQYFPLALLELKRLRQLRMTSVGLKNIPSAINKLYSLEILDLSCNEIDYLPKELSDLLYLDELGLEGNLLPIPDELLFPVKHDSFNKSEPEPILAYYFNTRHQPSQPICEAKILILGEAGVGKSALVKRLVHDQYNEERILTFGVEITDTTLRDHDIVISDTTIAQGKDDYILHLWDFGGQEVMHATHQFFLSKRCLYLLVLDASQNEDQNKLDLWLKRIRLLTQDAPIIVIVNKSDLFPLRLDEKGLTERYNIAAFIETSCATGQGIDTLKQQIAALLPKIPNIQDLIPEVWLHVKQRLAAQTGERKNYLTYTDFKQVCRDEHIPDEQIDSVAYFFDALGIALRYQDRMEHTTHVLNPNWVTKGIYPIITDGELLARGGILEGKDIARLLNATYNDQEQSFLLDMMVEFELAFPLEHRAYLVPALLPKERPSFAWNELQTLTFVYEYDVIPPNLFDRFVVRRKENVNQQALLSTVWRTGVLLHRKGKPYSLTTVDQERRRITVQVRTDLNGDPRDRLNDLRDTFEDLYRGYEGLKVNELIPLPHTRPVEYVEYRRLLRLEERGRDTYPGDNEDYEVSELLNGVASAASRRERAIGRERARPAIQRRAILSLFASPVDQDKLSRLNTERRRQEDTLSFNRNYVYYATTPTKESLERELENKPPYLFHYSGHAVAAGILLEDSDTQESDLILWRGLGERLAMYRQTLEIIVLNGCATVSSDFFEGLGTDRPIVIATTESVFDSDAANFTVAFYEYLAKGNEPRLAFDKARNSLALTNAQANELFRYIAPTDPVDV